MTSSPAMLFKKGRRVDSIFAGHSTFGLQDQGKDRPRPTFDFFTLELLPRGPSRRVCRPVHHQRLRQMGHQGEAANLSALALVRLTLVTNDAAIKNLRIDGLKIVSW